jgi:thymidylate kinase
MVKPAPGDLAPPRFIYITGCDGTGKTTQASLLVEQLRARGIKTRRVWLRFPFFFSLPLLAYARLRGYSWYEETGGVRHGYWDFRPSRLLRLVFPWFLLADAALAVLWRIYLPLAAGWTIVCERFVLDILADLGVALGDHRLCTRLPGRLFLRLLPLGAKVVLLDLSPALIQARREDLKSDRALSDKQRAFRAIGAACNLPQLSSEDSITQVNQRIWDLLTA